MGDTWIFVPFSARTYAAHRPHLYLLLPSNVSVSKKLDLRDASIPEDDLAVTSTGMSIMDW